MIIRHGKFLAVLLLECTATVCLSRDHWFGSYGFSVEFNWMILALVLLSISALAWESRLFGPPRGINLFLQGLFAIPFYLFCYRLLANSPRGEVLEKNLWNELLTLMHTGIELTGILANVPGWIRTMFGNLPLLGLLVLLLVLCAFRSPTIRLGGALMLGIWGTVAGGFAPQGAPEWFIPGALLLGGAALLLFEPRRELDACAILQGSLQSINDPVLYEDCLRLAYTTWKRGYLDGETATKLLSAPEAAPRVFHELAEIRSFLTLETGNRGTILHSTGELSPEESPLAAFAVYPRTIFFYALALLWILSPIDLIPDAIPVAGVLDDLTISLLATAPLLKKHLKR